MLTYAPVSDLSGVSDKTNTTEHWQNWSRTLTERDTSWFDIFNRTWYAWNMHIYVLIRKNTSFFILFNHLLYKSPTKGDFSHTFCNFPCRLPLPPTLGQNPPTVGFFFPYVSRVAALIPLHFHSGIIYDLFPWFENHIVSYWLGTIVPFIYFLIIKI